jgi:hypothetical protein
MDKKYYTYVHIRNDTNTIFYVGKGSGARFLWKYKRKNLWEKIVKKHGYTAHIVSYWNTEEEAFAHEKQLIQEYRGDGLLLANFTGGGDGISGYRFTREQKEKLSQIAKSKYQDPEFYKKMSVIRKNQWTQEARLKASNSSKAVWSEETKAEHSKKLKESYSSAEMRMVQADRNRKYRESQEGRKAMSERSKKYWASPKSQTEEAKKMRSDATRKGWETRRAKKCA